MSAAPAGAAAPPPPQQQQPQRSRAWPAHCANLGAFMVPGLALWLPSGYSWGAAVLLLAALASAPAWLRPGTPRAAWALAAAWAAMALPWLLDAGALPASGWHWGSLDRPLKYLLALPCIFYLLRCAPRAGWLWAGVALGASGSGLLGLWQTQWRGLARASGFTNAIQYGNLSLLLALLCGLLLALQYRRLAPWQRAALLAALLLGAAGSVLSQSRGGWLTLALLLPALGWLLAQHSACSGQRRIGAGLCALLLCAAALSQLPPIERRVHEAQQDVQTYRSHGSGQSSVGQRLVHWQLAWQLGLARPLTGWGQAGYMQEKARRVAAGQADASVLEYGHAHNELLDLFAKHGLPGVLLLLAFYGVPLALFWPRAARIRGAARAPDGQALALCLAGVALPLAYFGFGLTQVFLAHNSGNMFYLFMCPLLLAALHRRHAELDAAGPGHDQGNGRPGGPARRHRAAPGNALRRADRAAAAPVLPRWRRACPAPAPAARRSRP